MPGPLQLIRALTAKELVKPAERKVLRAMADDASLRQRKTNDWLFNFAAKHYDGDQRAALQDPRVIEVMRKAHPLGMMRANLEDAAQVAETGNVTLRLMLAPNAARPTKQADASLTHHGVGYHQDRRGLPENGVYVEGLSSTVPGGGTQLLKELEAQYPGAPMYLQSLDDASSQFYLKKGFVPQPDNSSPEIFRDLFVKPADVKLRAIAGVPAGTMLTEDHSVMDDPRLSDRVSAFMRQLTEGAVEGAKDPGNWLAAGLMGSGGAYQEGGRVSAEDARQRLRNPPLSKLPTAAEAWTDDSWGGHATRYDELGDWLAKAHGSKSGSVTDTGKAYGGAWDFVTRTPFSEDAEDLATLHQLRQYLSPSAASRKDAIEDLADNLAGIRDAKAFVGPPDPPYVLMQRSERWAKEHPRKAQGGSVQRQLDPHMYDAIIAAIQ